MSNASNLLEQFKKLYAEQKEILESLNEDWSKALIEFVESGFINEFEVMEEESSSDDNEICFVFGVEFYEANESSNYNPSANYTIVYDKKFKRFTCCEYEQG